MHDVEALIAREDKLAAGAARLASAVICPLVQGFALLPITEPLAKELAIYHSDGKAALGKLTLSVSDGLQALAIELSRGCPVAYINTYYFGGQGGQDALVWIKGNLSFSPRDIRLQSSLAQYTDQSGAADDRGRRRRRA